jgi:hypothetical protein
MFPLPLSFGFLYKNKVHCMNGIQLPVLLATTNSGLLLSFGFTGSRVPGSKGLVLAGFWTGFEWFIRALILSQLYFALVVLWVSWNSGQNNIALKLSFYWFHRVQILSWLHSSRGPRVPVSQVQRFQGPDLVPDLVLAPGTQGPRVPGLRSQGPRS